MANRLQLLAISTQAQAATVTQVDLWAPMPVH